MANCCGIGFDSHVMIIPKLGFFTILKEVPRAFKDTMAESPVFITSRGSVIQVKADKSDIVEVDGEMEGNLPLTISVTGSKINVLATEGLLKFLLSRILSELKSYVHTGEPGEVRSCENK